MARKKAKTDDPTPYTAADEAALIAAMTEPPAGADSFEVDADVEWAGTTNPSAHRTLRVDRVQLDSVREAARKAQEAAGIRATRSKSYTAKGWRAQLNALSRTGVGRQHLGQHVTATSRTQSSWAKGGTPSKANREAIAAAYEATATRKERAATGAQQAANKAAAERLSEALEGRFGAPIRLTNISRWEWK